MTIEDSTPATGSIRSKVTVKPRRKTKVANVLCLDPWRIKEKNREAYEKMANNYLNEFSETERRIALDFAKLLLDNASMIRREKPDSSEIIQFPTK